jgi:hypothetical protein
MKRATMLTLALAFFGLASLAHAQYAPPPPPPPPPGYYPPPPPPGPPVVYYAPGPPVYYVPPQAAPPGSYLAPTYSKFDVYVGYDYTRFNMNNPFVIGSPYTDFNANGGSGQFIFNLNDWFGLEGEIAGYVEEPPNGAASSHQISYMFGPRLSFRNGRYTPFVEILFGDMWAQNTFYGGSANAFSMVSGGGLDVNITPHFGIRPFEVDYLFTTFNDGFYNQQNNFRYSGGLIFHTGRNY